MMESTSRGSQRHSFEELEELELRRRRRALEIKRLQVEESKLELERASLRQQQQRQQRSGQYGMNQLSRGGGNHAGGSLQHQQRLQRGGRPPLNIPNAQAVRSGGPSRQQQYMVSNHPYSSNRSTNLVNQRVQQGSSTTTTTTTGGQLSSRGRKQRRGQGSLERRREARAAAREAAIKEAALAGGKTTTNNNEWFIKSDGKLHAGAPAFEPAGGGHGDRGAQQEESSYIESGWNRIADMLHDSNESNRTSAVHALHVLGVDSLKSLSNSGQEIDVPSWSNSSFINRNWAQTSWQSSPWTGESDHITSTASDRARESAYRAVLDTGGIAPLVDLLSDDATATQQAAVDVLRSVVAASNKDNQQNEANTPLTPHTDYSDNNSNSSSVSCTLQRQLMEEANVVGPILRLLESDDADVRASALGTVSELAHASEEARQQFFQEPGLLTSLLEIVEQKENPGAELLLAENNENVTASSFEEEKKNPLENYREQLYDDQNVENDMHDIEYPSEQYYQGEDRTQAVGVLKLMLEEEDSAQRVRDALAARPGVVESIVDVTTQHWPQTNDTVLQGLGPQASEVAASAVVHLLGDGSEQKRIESNRQEDTFENETIHISSSVQPPNINNNQKISSDYISPPPGFQKARSKSLSMDSSNSVDGEERRRRQLAAMAAMRNLVANETATEDSATRAALIRIRSTGGVDAVVDLLSDEDPVTQASASYTLRALVKADDYMHHSGRASLDENIDEMNRADISQVTADEEKSNNSITLADSSLRSEIAAGQAVRKLVAILLHANEEPGAAMQAVATLAELVQGKDEEIVATGSGCQEIEDIDATESVKDISSESRVEKNTLVKSQLKQAIHENNSVIPALIDLLREALDAGEHGNTAARKLAETLRAAAESDLVNQMQIRDAGGVRLLMALIAQVQEKIDETKSTVVSVSPPDSNASEIAPTRISAPIDDDDSKIDLVRHVGNVWLSSEPRANEDAIVPTTSTKEENNFVATASTKEKEDLIKKPLVLANSSSAATNTASTAAISIRDDIGVRLGTKSNEFGHECTPERILEQPLGFRQWYITHSVTQNMRRRAVEARADQNCLGRALNKLRGIEEQLRHTLANHSQPIEESLLQRYDRLQRELDYVQDLYDSLGRECDALEQHKFDSYLPEDADNAKAELYLLDSTLKVLGDIGTNGADSVLTHATMAGKP